MDGSLEPGIGHGAPGRHDTGAGIAATARVATPGGWCAAGDLAPGQLVLTPAGRAVPLLIARPAGTAGAVRIAAGALGGGLPFRPLRLAPGQRLRLGGWRCELVAGCPSALARAEWLASGPDAGPAPMVRLAAAVPFLLVEGVALDCAAPGLSRPTLPLLTAAEARAAAA